MSKNLKVNKLQRETLWKMSDEKQYCAYLLSVSMNTMLSLQNRGLIKRTNLGVMSWEGFDRTNHLFKITKSGMKVLKNEN